MKRRQVSLDCFKSCYIAHRGFFDNGMDAPENTVLAFKKAVDAGYGIELDVQLSQDKRVVVTHDYDLKRICGVNELVKNLSYQELCEYKIFDTAESIPLLTDVLQVIDGKVPLIVEIKAEREYEEVCRLTAEILSSYSGVYCVESFSPYVVNWYRRNKPDVIRGQLADDFFKNKKPTLLNWALTNMIFNVISKPDFIAYNHHSSGKKCIRFWEKALGCSLAAWTINSQAELDRAAEIFDVIIFDGFTPKQL